MQATLKPNPLATKQSKTFLRFLLDWAAVITLVLCFVVFTLLKGNRFMSVNNMINILRAMSITTVFGIAATVTMAPDGFDMSALYAGQLLGLCVCEHVPVVRPAAVGLHCGMYPRHAGDVSADHVPHPGLQDSRHAGNLRIDVRASGSGPMVHRRRRCLHRHAPAQRRLPRAHQAGAFLQRHRPRALADRDHAGVRADRLYLPGVHQARPLHLRHGRQQAGRQAQRHQRQGVPLPGRHDHRRVHRHRRHPGFLPWFFRTGYVLRRLPDAVRWLPCSSAARSAVRRNQTLWAR